MKNKRVIITLGYILLSVFLAQACAFAGVCQNNDKADTQAGLITNAEKAIKKYNLAKITSDCLLFEVTGSNFKDLPLVVARERHGGSCGGDPDTSPRIFSIAIDEETGTVWSDAKSLLGLMEKVSK